MQGFSVRKAQKKSIKLATLDFKSLRDNWTNFSRKIFTPHLGEKAPLSKKEEVYALKDGTANTFDSSLDEEIKNLIKDNDFLVNGKVSLINLGTIKEKLGNKWEKYAEFVHQFAEKVIEKRVTSQDIYYRVGEDTYVFVFADLSEEEAVIKCSLIAKEIGEQVFGDDWSSDKFGTAVAVASTDGEILLEEASLTNSITKSLMSAKKINPKEILENTPAAIAQKAMTRIEDDISEIEKVARTPAASQEESLKNFRTVMNGIEKIEKQIVVTNELTQLNESSPQWQAFTNRVEGEEGSNAKPMDGLAGKLAALIGDTEKLYGNIQDTILERIEEAEEEEEVEEEDELDEPDMAFSYYPILQPVISKIHSYRLTSQIILEKSLWNFDELPQTMEPSAIATFDQLLLRRAIVDLVDCVNLDMLNVIIVPVHFSTLNVTSYRSAYVDICATIPKSMRDLISFEITQSGVQNWHSQLINAISGVKRFARMVCLEMDINSPQFTDLKAIGVDCVGFTWKTGSMSVDAARTKFMNFGKRASQEGLRTYMMGTSTTALYDAAVAANIDFIGGEAIAEGVKQPQGSFEFTVDKKMAAMT